MPTNPIDTLIELNAITAHLEYTQMLVDEARSTYSSDSFMQLVLDRKQSAIDERREFVRHMLLYIPAWN